MLFNSPAFIFGFLPLALSGFFLIARCGPRAAATWLALASVAFYAWWNPLFVLLLLGSAVANFFLARAILTSPQSRSAQLVLISALALNLGVLVYFKYANFFIGAANAIGHMHLALVHVVLPLGISFFTFTQIAYLVDAYRGQARTHHFVDYLLFVSYFPHLVAGPILHHAEVLPQLEAARTYRLRLEAIAVGLTLFAIGLAKKVLLADPLGEFANAIFDSVHAGARPHLIASWGGAIAYTLQLYFDFSGYSDMAVGISMLFNVRLPLNFDSPYKATSIAEFWRRWHMTLSRFLRNYLYIPLGGNRRGAFRRCVNVMITMLIGGLWHGANWTFVAWGGLHGAYLLLNYSWTHLNVKLPRIAASAITFGAVTVAWVFFRASDFTSAVSMLRGMAGQNGISLPVSISGLSIYLPGVQQAMDIVYEGALRGWETVPGGAPRLMEYLAAGLAIVWAAPNSQNIARLTAGTFSTITLLPSRAVAALAGALLAFSIMGLSRFSTFLYYQF